MLLEMNAFVPLMMLAGVAALICTAMVTLSWLLGPKKITPYKQSPYECGVAPSGSARERFPIKFYLVAMLFILFDIEVVFLWSWLSVFKNAPLDYQIFSFWAVMIYMLLWIIGDAYVIKIGALEWDEGSAEKEAQMGLAIAEGRLEAKEAADILSEDWRLRGVS